MAKYLTSVYVSGWQCLVSYHAHLKGLGPKGLMGFRCFLSLQRFLFTSGEGSLQCRVHMDPPQACKA